jgi:hypothetical protein
LYETPRQEDQDVGHRVFRVVEKLNVGSPAAQLWGKPGFATRVFAMRVFAVRVFMHLDEPRRYPHGLLPEFPAQALLPLPPGYPQREGDCCNGPDRGHPCRNGPPLHGAHIAIMGDGTDCPTGPNGSKEQACSQNQFQPDSHASCVSHIER